MLKELSIKNFAIIEDISISFYDGLTVLTGETGAGKSLIIDSISLLLGNRATTELIRNGYDKAEISGLFSFTNKRIEALLHKLDIDYVNNEITISRTIYLKQSSVMKINNKVVSLNEAKDICKYLADIHEQFDMVKLLNKDNYLDMIDGMRFDFITEYKDKYLSSLDKLKEKEREYIELENKIKDINLKREEYEYTLNELKSFDLKEGEEKEIDNEIELLKNYDKIFSLVNENKEIIDRDSLNDLYRIKDNVKELSSYQEEYKDLYENINNYYYEIEAIYDELKKKARRLDYDPSRLDYLIERKNTLNSLKKKYNRDEASLREYQKELENLLNNKEDFDIYLLDKKKELINQYEETYSFASSLSKLRREISLNIEKELMNNLLDLGLKVNFKIDIISKEKDKDYSLSIFTTSGIDEVEFLIETNIGEGLKPLSKVISGGEASRIMLALKMLFIKSSKIETIILDEVDSGISGEIASKVSNKIKDLSLFTQVISITHLPQLASKSNNHIKISKVVKNNRTYTVIKELNLEEKIYEVASLISGNKVTDKQIEYAKEMILNNN